MSRKDQGGTCRCYQCGATRYTTEAKPVCYQCCVPMVRTK